MPMPLLLADITPFDWPRMLWSAEAPPLFLLEVAVRAAVAYLLTLAALRVTGRRGVRQLSIFELSIILSLGSAAGDAMLYHDTPLLYVVVVFGVVMGLYLLLNRLTERRPGFSDWLEGKPVRLIANGTVEDRILRKHNLTQKELFGQLRQYQVEHLGQVRLAYIEATGEISVFFYAPEDTRPGLSILPERLEQSTAHITEAGSYACTECGAVVQLAPVPAHACAVCRGPRWLPACTTRRVA